MPKHKRPDDDDALGQIREANRWLRIAATLIESRGLGDDEDPVAAGLAIDQTRRLIERIGRRIDPEAEGFGLDWRARVDTALATVAENVQRHAEVVLPDDVGGSGVVEVDIPYLTD